MNEVEAINNLQKEQSELSQEAQKLSLQSSRNREDRRDLISSGQVSRSVYFAYKAKVPVNVMQATKTRYNDLKALFMSPENATEYYKNRDSIQAQTKQDIANQYSSVKQALRNLEDDKIQKIDFKSNQATFNERLSQLSSKYSNLFETETDAYSCDIGEDVSY